MAKKDYIKVKKVDLDSIDGNSLIKLRVDGKSFAHIEVMGLGSGGISLSVYSKHDEGRDFIKWVPGLNARKKKQEEE